MAMVFNLAVQRNVSEARFLVTWRIRQVTSFQQDGTIVPIHEITAPTGRKQGGSDEGIGVGRGKRAVVL